MKRSIPKQDTYQQAVDLEYDGNDYSDYDDAYDLNGSYDSNGSYDLNDSRYSYDFYDSYGTDEDSEEYRRAEAYERDEEPVDYGTDTLDFEPIGTFEAVPAQEHYTQVERKPSRSMRFRAWTKRMGPAVISMLCIGVLVLVLTVVCLVLAVRSRGNETDLPEASVDVNLFADVGRQLDYIDIFGGDGIAAVVNACLSDTDSVIAKGSDDTAHSLPPDEDPSDYVEKPISSEVTVKLKLSSIEKDLKVKFTNKETGKLIAGVPFNISVRKPDGGTDTWEDGDMDGIIHKSGIAGGEYTVSCNALKDDRYKDYTLPSKAVSTQVVDEIVLEKVEIAEEIKKESEVSASEDIQASAAQETPQESALEDTVIWVESTVNEGLPQYIAVAKADIARPEGEAETPDTPTTPSAMIFKSYAITSAYDPNAPLTDDKGNRYYLLQSDGTYRAAVNADYFSDEEIFYLRIPGDIKYTGWQLIDGDRYYYDVTGVPVTGDQVIQGAKYTFGADGVLVTESDLGIDVSKFNNNIDWKSVRNSGVSFAIIRCGFRGSSTGVLVEDSMFRTNIKGATNAGLKVGVYFFTQATNRVEAVEEASMVLELVKNYKLKMPIFLDVEGVSGSRAQKLSAAERTDVICAFCDTVRNSGYRAGVYSNKTWFTTKMEYSRLSPYVIWYAQYSEAPTFDKKYDIWQYSSKGTVSGIQGNVDMNINYTVK